MNRSEKIRILTESAKYDVSCSSSGSNRKSKKGGIGNGNVSGICHSWSEDGRCISLLKILYTNYCIYDCDYCINRKRNDIERAIFEPRELANLVIEFYRRNYIEGLFLSSGVYKSPDETMSRLLEVARILRKEYKFGGYIHMKAIPGVSQDLLDKLGELVDRVSVNIELATPDAMRKYAPDKKKTDILRPMSGIRNGILQNREDRKAFKHAPKYVPAGQSTQMIVGAGKDTDYTLLKESESLYDNMKLKRVYYSAFVPIKSTIHLKNINEAPLLREHRLYQSDFLLRRYSFKVDEILSPEKPVLDTALDPKANWAMNHLDVFPVELTTASYHDLLRIPGIGPKSARRIVKSRKYSGLTPEFLRKMGVVWKRAQYFITIKGKFPGEKVRTYEDLRRRVSDKLDRQQLSIFDMVT